MNNSKINLLVVTSIPFPYGLASTNRIISYSKGLVELGETVSVITSNWDRPTQKVFYEFEGIKYRTFGKERKGQVKKTLDLILSVFKLWFFMLNKVRNYNSVLIVSNNFTLIVLTYLACKMNGVKLYQEKSEFPFVLNNKSIFGRLYAKFYVNNVYKLFDGMVIMTYPLLEYFKDKTNKGCQKIVVPMTVEANRFQGIEKNTQLGDYIGYCGYIGGNKDGVENLIRSFALVEKKYPALKLLLVGPAQEEDYKKLNSIVKTLGIKNVIFFGPVSRDEIPSLLCNAKILALARPSSLQSTGGFPTKLGEYLSTGKPVVVTKVGDIPRYLKDRYNAYLVDPDDNEQFANKISEILDNYDKALQIASEGKKLVYNDFSYAKQAKRMQEFFLEQGPVKRNIEILSK